MTLCCTAAVFLCPLAGLHYAFTRAVQIATGAPRLAACLYWLYWWLWCQLCLHKGLLWSPLLRGWRQHLLATAACMIVQLCTVHAFVGVRALTGSEHLPTSRSADGTSHDPGEHVMLNCCFWCEVAFSVSHLQNSRVAR